MKKSEECNVDPGDRRKREHIRKQWKEEGWVSVLYLKSHEWSTSHIRQLARMGILSERVLIIGGKKTQYYLASELSKHKELHSGG